MIGLAFHVDYWNYLNWKDPYSLPEYTERQRNYAQALGSRRMYTPQMIVNGRYGFVGSNRSQGQQAIDEALSNSAHAEIQLQVEQVESDQLQVSYTVSGTTESNLLQLALVEGGIVRKIKSGENGGLTLKHENVVRQFKSIPLKQGTVGKAMLQIPDNLVSENAAVIAYVQQAEDMHIVGATQMAL